MRAQDHEAIIFKRTVFYLCTWHGILGQGEELNVTPATEDSLVVSLSTFGLSQSLPQSILNLCVLPGSPATHAPPPMLLATPVGPVAAVQTVSVNLRTCILFEDYSEAF